MDRIFEFDNKNEIKLEVDGFDKAPILIGTEHSNGKVSLENLENFQGCNIYMKVANIKDESDEVSELKTYYTVVDAKTKKYNNDIIEKINKKESSKIHVEVCLGIDECKRYLILEYASTENLVSISKQLPNQLYKMFLCKEENNTDTVSNRAKITFYDTSGFEVDKVVSVSDISEYILSVRIIGSNTNTIKDNVSQKAQNVYKAIKKNGKNTAEVISNFTSSVVKILSLKKKV